MMRVAGTPPTPTLPLGAAAEGASAFGWGGGGEIEWVAAMLSVQRSPSPLEGEGGEGGVAR
jgi:hypothetical protein